MSATCPNCDRWRIEAKRLECAANNLEVILKAVALQSGGEFCLYTKYTQAISEHDQLHVRNSVDDRCMIYRYVRAEDKGVAEAVELLKAKGYKVEKA